MMKREYTATVFIVQAGKVLLIKHKKYNKWLPPGGHLDPGEIPCDGAVREAKEETGLDIALIKQENVWVETKSNSGSFTRPYLCLIENIAPRHEEEAHQHIDFIYLGYPIGGKMKVNQQETDGMKWFGMHEVEELETYHDVKEIVREILKNNSRLEPK